ncbi:MAG: glycosyltransferase family 2 protein [Polyangiaceae bacterium]|nr:glycosyltransferase family 2 protein [Polyangiaceae bacterium]
MAEPPSLSFVIPVYNGAHTVGDVVKRIHSVFAGQSFEVILVNDGSADDSEAACRELRKLHRDTVTFVHLARNFGEHSAVLAGLSRTRGAYVAVLDDDGQNPPEEVPKLLAAAKRHRWDVTYGRFRVKRHSWVRNFGSQFNDRLANVMLKKPRDLYLSSFKLMDRFVVREILRYRGAFPYIDGLILRTTRNVGQVEVEHSARQAASSNYTLRKLIWLWLNMFLNFSILPLRVAVVLGLGASGISLPLLILILIDKLFITPGVTLGIPTVLATVVLFSGVQLVVLGLIGEYLGRLFLDHSQAPQFVIRYIQEPGSQEGIVEAAPASGQAGLPEVRSA